MGHDGLMVFVVFVRDRFGGCQRVVGADAAGRGCERTYTLSAPSSGYGPEEVIRFWERFADVTRQSGGGTP